MSEPINLRIILYAQVLPALQACRDRAKADAELQYRAVQKDKERAIARRARSAEVQLALEHAASALLTAIEKDGE